MNTKRVFETYADYEPVADYLRAHGFDAHTDDYGHMNYGVAVLLPEPCPIGSLFAACADGEGEWGYSLEDRESFLAGGESLPDTSPATPTEVIGEQLRTVITDLLAGRNLAKLGFVSNKTR